MAFKTDFAEQQYDFEPRVDLKERPVSIVIANTEKLRRASYGIRYAVYCEQLKYEAPAKFTTHEEFDEFDRSSIHILLRDDYSKQFVGTVRLVHPSAGSCFPCIPLQKFYSGRYYGEYVTPDSMEPSSFIEVSRLALMKPLWGVGSLSMWARQLYIAALAYFHYDSNLSHMYCFMEPRLAIKLNRVGIPFFRVGDFVDHRGERAPYYLAKKKFLFKQLGIDTQKDFLKVFGMLPYMVDR